MRISKNSEEKHHFTQLEDKRIKGVLAFLEQRFWDTGRVGTSNDSKRFWLTEKRSR